MEVVILVAVMAVALLSWYFAASEAKRNRALARAARSHGLQFAPVDPFGCSNPPFELFRSGDERGTENVMWRQDAPGDPRVFDYWFADVYRDRDGRPHRTYTSRTCATLDVGWMWPYLMITRERFLQKLGRALGMQDIDFESGEFNKAFNVRCEDRRFASAFIDAQMIELLLSTKGLVDVEAKGRWLLVHTERLKGNELPALLKLAETIAKRIPPVVGELWPVPEAKGAIW